MRARVAAAVVVATAAATVVVASAASPGGLQVSLAVGDAVVAEGNRGTRTLAFVVRASGSSDGPASVRFATARGTASAPADYARTSGSLRFDRRTRTRTVTVRIAGDTAGEFDETFRVVLSKAAGARIADANGIGTIADDDNPPLKGVRVAAAGDIACDPNSEHFEGGRGDGVRCRQLATSTLLVNRSYAAVLALGDVQYDQGSFAAFLESYAPSWGRVRSTTRPVPGNHEYGTEDAEGYHRYFGAKAGEPGKGYYSYDLGHWHLVALNSNCSEVGGCGAGSPQDRWLRADLGANPARCTLAYWHHPRFSSGEHGHDTTYTAFWRALHDASADLVLVGHDHGYERFAPQTPSGTLDLVRGIREFVVGTGGKELRGFSTVRPNSEVRNRTSLGVLELTLGTNGYEWRFLPAVGSFTDAGSATCR